MCPKVTELLSWNGPTVHVCCFMLARASTNTFVSRIHIRQPSPKNNEQIFVSRKIGQQGHSLAEVSLQLQVYQSGSMPWFSLQISVLLILVFSTHLLWWFAAIKSEDGPPVVNCVPVQSAQSYVIFATELLKFLYFRRPPNPFSSNLGLRV